MYPIFENETEVFRRTTVMPNIIMKLNKLLLTFTILIPNLSWGQEMQSQKVIFDSLTLTIKEFKSEYYRYAKEYIDTSMFSGNIDTIYIGENPCDEEGWYIYGQTISVKSKNNDDKFEISIALEIFTRQFIDYDNTPVEEWAELEKNHIEYMYVTKYFALEKFKENVFKLPYRDTILSYNYQDVIKKIHNFQDTSLTISQEMGSIYIPYKKEGKLFYNDVVNYRIKIERYRCGEIIESKYIIVELSDGCD
jgi:hypothetical protein